MAPFEQLAERARQIAAAPAGPVPSPCISVCRMDAALAYCEGCLRTLDEIAGWSALGDEDKKRVWAQIARRIVIRQAQDDRKNI